MQQMSFFIVGKNENTAGAQLSIYRHAELGTFGIFEFFQTQKLIFCIFYQVNLTGSGLFK